MLVQVTKISLHWSEEQIDLLNIDEEYRTLDDTGLYALIASESAPSNEAGFESTLLYIGKAYDQTIRERIKQDHEAYSRILNYLRLHKDAHLFIMTGLIEERAQKRDTQSLVSDIEACLIRTHQPLCNVQSVKSYNGRPIEIINIGGFFPLKKKCTCNSLGSLLSKLNLLK